MYKKKIKRCFEICLYFPTRLGQDANIGTYAQVFLSACCNNVTHKRVVLIVCGIYEPDVVLKFVFTFQPESKHERMRNSESKPTKQILFTVIYIYIYQHMLDTTFGHGARTKNSRPSIIFKWK